MSLSSLLNGPASIGAQERNLDAEKVLPGAWRVVDRRCNPLDPGCVKAFAEAVDEGIEVTHLGAIPTTCRVSDIDACVDHLEAGTECCSAYEWSF
jgi:hypothetical protein